MKKFPTLLWTLFVVIIISFLFFSPKKAPSVLPQQEVQVETALVTEKIFSDQFEAIGSLASIDHIEISSELAGQIAQIHFKPGTWVKKGTLLIELDNTILKNQLATAKANLTLSETNYQRIAELSKKQLTSEQALDQAFADLHKKQNAVKVRQAQLEKLSLHAPFSGTLGSRQVSVGQYVKVGQPLVSLIANQQLRVEYNLPERLISRLKVGQQIRIYSEAFPEKSYKGVINYIAPAVDRETRTIAVEALIDNSQKTLSTGLFVKVRHRLGDPKLRLLVPEESIIPTINGQKIFVLQGNKAVAKRVITGAHHFSLVEVHGGIDKDDVIIVRGQHKLKEGSQVIAINQDR